MWAESKILLEYIIRSLITIFTELPLRLKESLPGSWSAVQKISSFRRDASLIWESICGKCPESIIAHFYVWTEVLAWGMAGINDPLCRKRQSPGLFMYSPYFITTYGLWKGLINGFYSYLLLIETFRPALWHQTRTENRSGLFTQVRT